MAAATRAGAGDTPANIFIVGAGFSANAGLPLAFDFTRQLLAVEHMKKGTPSQGLVAMIRRFVEKGFHHPDDPAPQDWPELEDLFTTIDLSANTGHHLGPDFPPAVLRTVRRALIVRTVRMLSQRYATAQRLEEEPLLALRKFFGRVEPSACAFLSMNWDMVIERGLGDAHGIQAFDYGCAAQAAKFTARGLSLRPQAGQLGTILKPHGSINWLYCDACRHVFWAPPDQTFKVAGQLFRERDWETVRKATGLTSKADPSVNCPTCEADALGTRIATFSYRKALDFPMHARTWQTAEELLYGARNWIFIGYSLPAADYEFKLLLKRVERSRTSRPNIVLVTGGDEEVAERTRATYEKFFGPRLAKDGPNVFLKGLDAAALDGLARLGCLAKAKPKLNLKRPLIRKTKAAEPAKVRSRPKAMGPNLKTPRGR